MVGLVHRLQHDTRRHRFELHVVVHQMDALALGVMPRHDASNGARSRHGET